MKELSIIQQRLKAPKDQNNSYGNYKYRKASDILEAVKPLLAEANLSILLDDEVQVMEGKAFLIATATLVAEDGSKIASTRAFAQMDAHKGMSAEQATGAASSYARKYALCGLLAIDDSTDDPDSLRPADKQKAATKAAPAAAPAPAPTTSPLMAKIQAIRTADDLNALVDPIRKGTQEEMNAYVAKVRALGLTYDKTTQRYVSKNATANKAI